MMLYRRVVVTFNVTWSLPYQEEFKFALSERFGNSPSYFDGEFTVTSPKFQLANKKQAEKVIDEFRAEVVEFVNEYISTVRMVDLQILANAENVEAVIDSPLRWCDDGNL